VVVVVVVVVVATPSNKPGKSSKGHKVECTRVNTNKQTNKQTNNVEYVSLYTCANLIVGIGHAALVWVSDPDFGWWGQERPSFVCGIAGTRPLVRER
jgi:hypothetical protein